MIEYFSQRPYLAVILVLFALLTLFVCFKAGQASSKRSKENEAIMKKLKEENEIRNEFAILTTGLARRAEPERLFRGVSLNLQKRIHDAPDMEAEFALFTQSQKEIYALSFVVEDGKENLSGFFRLNGSPLTNEALSAVNRLFDGEIRKIFKEEFDSFDPKNETASMIPEKIEKLDAAFASAVCEKDICTAAGAFIKENIDEFI